MSNRKPTFFTSDWHIGHANAIEFDNRPFRDVDHMHRSLVKNYNSQVPVNGVCYFLGDIGISSSEKTREVITQLNGTKIMVLGNHDKNMNAMYNCGFDVVVYGAVIYIGGERVTMSHCPLVGVYRENLDHLPEHKKHNPPENWHGEYKNTRFTFTNENQFHLHGHIHSNKDTPHKVPILGRQFDVGVPANGYRPVSIGQIESWIMKYKRDLK